MLAACGGDPAPASIDGHWRVFPKVLDDTCHLGFASQLDVIDIAGEGLTASGRASRLTADGDTWRSSARVSNPSPCPQRDGFESWEVRATSKGLVGTYESLFAAGGSCEPICLVRVSFTGIHRDDPVTERNAGPGPLGTWRPMPLLTASEVATGSPGGLAPPPNMSGALVPPPSGIPGPLGLLPPGAAPIPDGMLGAATIPCPGVLPPGAGFPTPPPLPVPEAP
jgi:hypothetical protein